MDEGEITARARISEVADPTELLTAFFEGSPTALQVYAADGTCLATNAAFRRLFGAEPPPGYNVLVDDQAERLGILPSIRRAFAGETTTIPPEWYDPRDLRSVSVPEGNRVAISATFFPLRASDGAVSRVAVAFRDVTAEAEARDDAERAVREALEARADVVFLAEAGAHLASTLDLETTLANVLALAIPRLGDFGFLDLAEPGGVRRLPAAHRDGRRLAILRATSWRRSEHPDLNLCALSTGRRALHATVDDAWLERASEGSPEALALMRSLDFRSMMTVPLRDRGQVLGALTLFRAGAPHGPGELDLADELARRAALAITNARLLAEASAAVTARDDFLSIASHELRTPLSTLRIVTGTLQRATRDEEGPLASRVREDAARIERQVMRLETLVSTLLDVSRITQGRLELDVADTDLVALAGDVLSRLSDALAEAGCEVTFAADGRVRGSWDPHRLDQVLTNVLTNAMKYGRGRPVRVRVWREGEHAFASVADEGIGISEKDQARIFGQFERAVSGAHYGGLGLGLWISRRIVEAHGGTIRVESAPGRGACFTVELPA